MQTVRDKAIILRIKQKYYNPNGTANLKDFTGRHVVVSRPEIIRLKNRKFAVVGKNTKTRKFVSNIVKI